VGLKGWFVRPGETVGQRTAGDLLSVEALTRDGLLVRSDGALVRYLAVVPGNPLVLDPDGCERMTRGFCELLGRVPAGMSVQFYAHASPVALGDLLAHTKAQTDGATAALVQSADPEAVAQGQALRRLASLHAESVALHAQDQAAVDVRYVLVAPYLPDAAGLRPPGALRRPTARRQPALERSVESHLRLARESLAHTESLKSALSGLDVRAQLMDGAQVADMLWSRLAPGAPQAGARAPSGESQGLLSDLDAPVDAAGAVRAAERLRAALCQGTIDLRARRWVELDDGLEQTIYLSRRPERTFYGWLVHAMQSDRPWVLSVHAHVRDRGAERERHNRRARRLWGLNEGSLDRRARPDRAQHDQQAELEELVDELSTGAQTLCDLAVYQTIRQPGPAADSVALGEAVQAAARDLASPVDAGVGLGDAQQPDLWLSALPLGLDAARRTMAMISRNAADSVPFLSTSCGSPDGLALGFANPGRTLERLDPFDAAHDNASTLLFSKSGGGKTMTTIALAAAALPRGCQVNVLDRSQGHWRFLCDLIPGAAHLELGSEDGATINPWDTPDPAAVPRAKVAFLVRLHALLIGDHDTTADAYGLDALERNLLAHAIRTVYHTAHTTAHTPCESLLRETLHQLGDHEAHGPRGTADNQAAYRSLAHRLGEFCDQGTYAYLFDRPTTIAAHNAPLVVFNTNRVPDDIAAPLLFSVLELVSRRVETRHEAHRRARAEGRPAAGPFDGTSAVVVEELWKLVERRATGSWVSELVKRARHIGLWFTAITQQRADLAGPHGRALLDNSTIALYLKNSPEDLRELIDAHRLSGEEVEQIARLTTEKHSHAQAYLANGERGRAQITIRHAPAIYWLATSDPHTDLPWRELALRDAGLHITTTPAERSQACFTALDLLNDPAWHARHTP